MGRSFASFWGRFWPTDHTPVALFFPSQNTIRILLLSELARIKSVARWGTTSQHIEKMFNLVICGYIKLNFKDAYMIKTSHLLVIFEILCHPPDQSKCSFTSGSNTVCTYQESDVRSRGLLGILRKSREALVYASIRWDFCSKNTDGV
jgi:hypothetical protein